MRIQIVVLALAMGLAMGCVTRFDETSVSFLWGDNMIGEDCTVYDGETECEKIIKGAELGGVAGGILGKVIDTVVGVAGKFVPGGLDRAEPDTLRVELVGE